MIRPSFVPPPEIRRLRDLTRYRADLVNVCTAGKNRVEKLPGDAQIKLSVVASDIFGVSGRERCWRNWPGPGCAPVLAAANTVEVRRSVGFAERLGANLAGFDGDQVGEVLFVLGEQLAEPLGHRAPDRYRGSPPAADAICAASMTRSIPLRRVGAHAEQVLASDRCAGGHGVALERDELNSAVCQTVSTLARMSSVLLTAVTMATPGRSCRDSVSRRARTMHN